MAPRARMLAYLSVASSLGVWVARWMIELDLLRSFERSQGDKERCGGFQKEGRLCACRHYLWNA